MKNHSIVRVLIVLFLSFPLFLFSKDKNERVKVAIKAINKQIETNERLIKQGKFDEVKYIVDVRGNWWQGDAENVTPEALNLANEKLKQINKENNVAFYSLLSSPYLPDDVHSIDKETGVEHFYFNNKYTSFPPQEKRTPEEENAYQQLNNQRLKITEDYLKDYTKKIALNSKLGDARNRGVLLNVECVLVDSYYESSQASPVSHHIQYYPIIALGSRLSAMTVEQATKVLRQDLIVDNEEVYFNINFKEALLFYVTTVGKNIKKLDPDNFTKDEVGNTLEAMLFNYPNSTGNLDKDLTKYYSDVKQGYKTVSEKKYGNVTVTDYAGLTEYDPQFKNILQSQIGDQVKNASNTIKELTDGEAFDLDIIITSDASVAAGEKTAIQRLFDIKGKLPEDRNYVRLAMHIRTKDLDITNSTIPVQIATKFNERLLKIVNEKRAEDGYCWYRHKPSRKIVYTKVSTQTVVDDYGYKQLGNPDWEYLGKYKADLNSKLIFNEYSNLAVLAVPAVMWDKFDGYMLKNGEVVGASILDVVYTVGTGGSFAVGKTFVKVGTKITIGATIDVALQMAIMHYFEGLTYEDAWKKVDYGQAGYAGVESLMDNWKTTAVLACVREATVNVAKAGKFDAVTVSKGCGIALASNYVLGGGLTNSKTYKNVISKIKEGDVVLKGLNNIGIKDDQLVTALKNFGFVTEKNGIYYLKGHFKNLKVIDWSNTIKGSVTDSKAFWNETGEHITHIFKDNFYFKYDKNSGKLLIGEVSSKKVYCFLDDLKSEISPESFDGILGQLKIISKTGNDLAPIIKAVDESEIAEKYLLKNIEVKDKSGRLREIKVEVTKKKNGEFAIKRYLAKTGEELADHLNNLKEIPEGLNYNGDLYRSLSIVNETKFGAKPEKMTDHNINSSWGRYDLDGKENAMYLSKTEIGNKTEIVPHYGNWEDYNTYKYEDVNVLNLLDLTNEDVLILLGVNKDMLTIISKNKDKMYEFTNSIAEWARKVGYNGINATGARGTNNYENIVLFNQDYIDNILKGKTPDLIIK